MGLDPAFTVMDAEEARLLRLEVARELLQDRYELDNDGSFQRLVDAYAEGNDERLLRHVLHAHELLGSLVDPQAWLSRGTRAAGRGGGAAADRVRAGRRADRPARPPARGACASGARARWRWSRG